MPILSLLSMVFSISGSVIGLVCLSNVIHPKWAWRTFDRKKDGEEPPEKYFLARRISGLLCLLVLGLIFLVVHTIF